MTPFHQKILEACEFDLQYCKNSWHQAIEGPCLVNHGLAWQVSAEKENARLFPIIRTLLESNAAMEQALEEAKVHFNSIRSGLTTDINKVESMTKSLAQAAHLEVNQALLANQKRMREIVGGAK